MSFEGAIAAHRFGLGARPGEIARASANPKAWLMAQLQGGAPQPVPPDGKPFDLHAFAEFGKQGVLALLQDSTNVDRHGYTPSERAVRPRLDEIFSQAKKKLFFSCFSS